MPDSMPSPRQILSTLLPHLRVAAAYASDIQSRIIEQPAKDYPGNIFAAALTDADLSVQTFVEVLLLGYFPQLRFFGEEHAKTFNTKYFRAIDLGPQGDYLITLDPIDGTRCYADGHSNYQIILNVLNADDFEATLFIRPSQNRYCFALRGEGAFFGALTDDMDDCQPLTIQPQNTIIHLGGGAGEFASRIRAPYAAYDLHVEYSAQTQMPTLGDLLLDGAYAGAILSRANFLDAAAIAFIAREAGCIVTTHDGDPPPPLHACEGNCWPGLFIATDQAVHDALQLVVQKQPVG